MPRKLRVEYREAMCHVMRRGDRRESIFVNDADRQAFRINFAAACHKTDWRVHAHCPQGPGCTQPSAWNKVDHAMA